MPRPYDQQPKETAKSYAAFREYCRLGPERSIEKLRQVLGEASVSQRWAEEWSSKHNWQERVRTYDADEQARLEKLYHKDRDRSRAARIKALDWLLIRAQIALGSLNPDEASWSQVAVALKTATDGLRTEHGDEPAQRHEISGPNGQPMESTVQHTVKTIEELDAQTLSRLYGGLDHNRIRQSAN